MGFSLDSKTGAEILNLLRASCVATSASITMVTRGPKATAQASRVRSIKDGKLVGDQHNNGSAA